MPISIPSTSATNRSGPTDRSTVVYTTCGHGSGFGNGRTQWYFSVHSSIVQTPTVMQVGVRYRFGLGKRLLDPSLVVGIGVPLVSVSWHRPILAGAALTSSGA